MCADARGRRRWPRLQRKRGTMGSRPLLLFFYFYLLTPAPTTVSHHNSDCGDERAKKQQPPLFLFFYLVFSATTQKSAQKSCRIKFHRARAHKVNFRPSDFLSLLPFAPIRQIFSGRKKRREGGRRARDMRAFSDTRTAAREGALSSRTRGLGAGSRTSPEPHHTRPRVPTVTSREFRRRGARGWRVRRASQVFLFSSRKKHGERGCGDDGGR